MLRNSASAWGAGAKVFHWTIAVLVIVQITLGLLAINWRLSPTKLDLYVWHKSTGMLILVLMFARVAWRLANPVPALSAAMPALQRRAAHATHFLIYALLIALPITGWTVASASNIPFRIYWTIPLPAIVAPDKAVERLASNAHLYLFIALAVLLVLHIAAALHHHFVMRDDVLSRMLQGKG